MNIRDCIGLSALAALLASACGGGKSSTPLTVDDLCTQKAQKECQVTTRCGFPTSDTCLTQRKAVCQAFATASTVAPRVFHPENIANCVNQTNTVYAKSTITPADLTGLNDVCSYVFQGNVALGGACTSKYDCTPQNLICDKLFCAMNMPTAKGAQCANRGQVCATGSYCAPDPTAGDALTCLAKAAAGAACSASIPCLENLRCDAVSQTCMALLTVSSACCSNSDCATTAPYCDPDSGNKCEVGLVFGSTATAACANFGGIPSGGMGGTSGGGNCAASSGTGGTSGGTGGASGGTGGASGGTGGISGGTGGITGDGPPPDAGTNG